MEARDLAFEVISVGDTASFERMVSGEDVRGFVEISGDKNPLHIDPVYAETTPFKRPIVHGMLLGSFCSTLVGMHLPGKRCVYLSQTLAFKKPVYVGDVIVVRGVVVAKSLSTRILTISISMLRDEEEVVSGSAMVQVLE